MSNFLTPDGHVSDEFAELMVGLAAAYSAMTGRLSEATIRIYAAALGDLTIGQVRDAMGRVVRESAYWPSVAEIRKAAVGSAEDAALLAWAGLRRAAGEVGAWHSLQVDDGAAAAALEAIGLTWGEFCALEEGPVLHVRRQEFLAAYRRLRPATAGPRLLPGLCEAGGGRPAIRRLTAGGTVEQGVKRLTGGAA